jgi:hypothetical protein
MKSVEEGLLNLGKKHFFKTVLKFRPPSTQQSHYHSSYSYGYDANPNQKEKIFYGLATGSHRLFVPHPLPRKMARKIQEIHVKSGDKIFKGEFAGALKKFGGFLVDVPKLKLPVVPVDNSVEVASRYQLFYSASIEYRFGRRDIQVDCNRFLSSRREFRARNNPISGGPLIQGEFLFDHRGRLMGVYAQEHQPHEEQLRIIKKQYHGSYLSTLRCRVFSVKEIGPVFKPSQQDLDPAVVVMTKKQHKRRLWLGIEYDVMNKDLARVMGVQKETKNGKIGLLVSKVYKSSPAATQGLELGDILLFIQEPDEPRLELAFEKSYGSSYNPYSYFSISGYESMDYGQRRPPLWPPRKNQLTDMLEVVGKDKKVRVGFLRKNQYREKDLVIRMAPNDFLSTEKYMNKKIGLTVKDFTYEVMDALQLGQGRHGIVVAKVDPGSPAAVGRIKMFEIIQAIDGKPVKNIKNFKKKIEKALSKKRKSVKLTVRDLDKTRFIDLVLNDK